MNRYTFAAALACALVCYACTTPPPSTPPDLCPMCKKPLADGPEVRVLHAGETGEGTRYRCFVCPIKEGETGEVWTLRAVSGLDGKWVTFHVSGDSATAEPATAVVLALPVPPGAECLDVHRVFTDEDEFRRYAQSHPLAREAGARRLDAVLVELRGSPRDDAAHRSLDDAARR